MKSELLFYAQECMLATGLKGLPAFPLAARCEPGSEYPHEDCWTAVVDPEEFFRSIGLRTVPEPGLWIASVEYTEDEITDGGTWEHLTAPILMPCGPVQFQEIFEQTHEQSTQTIKEIPSTGWGWL